ncbi:deoxyribonuclease IV [Bacteroidota bacterium]
MLELTSGQGTQLGYKFEHIKNLIKNIEKKGRISVCLDTAHIFAAGYDIRSNKSYTEVIKKFDSIIGLDRLKCIHINDSKKKLGTRIYRHEHIGKGFIGLNGFRNIMNDKRLQHIPKILETPKSRNQAEDVINLRKLKELLDW